jgi:hypothetical protein
MEFLNNQNVSSTDKGIILWKFFISNMWRMGHEVKHISNCRLLPKNIWKLVDREVSD